jgi:hypothetical protein
VDSGTNEDDRGDAAPLVGRGARVITTLVTSRRYAMGACALGRVARPGRLARAARRSGQRRVSARQRDARQSDAGRLDCSHYQRGASPLPIIKSDIFTKLALFDLLEYERVLFLDADTVAVRSFDELLTRRQHSWRHDVAMVPELMYPVSCRGNGTEQFAFTDVGGHQFCQGHAREPYHGIPDIKYYNSGVMLFKPSRRIFDGLLKLLARRADLRRHLHQARRLLPGSAADQSLLPQAPVRRLSLVYNWFCQKIIGDQTRSDAL